MSEHEVRIRGRYTADDGWQAALPLSPTGAWWDAPLPPCPDCGGDIVWWEAGYVPGHRKCVGMPIGTEADGRPVYDPDRGCGSHFEMTGAYDDAPNAPPRQLLRRARFWRGQ